jgi:hypothetical protein
MKLLWRSREGQGKSLSSDRHGSGLGVGIDHVLARPEVRHALRSGMEGQCKGSRARQVMNSDLAVHVEVLPVVLGVAIKPLPAFGDNEVHAVRRICGSGLPGLRPGLQQHRHGMPSDSCDAPVHFPNSSAPGSVCWHKRRSEPMIPPEPWRSSAHIFSPRCCRSSW